MTPPPVPRAKLPFDVDDCKAASGNKGNKGSGEDARPTSMKFYLVASGGKG
jgi:hypothetical protein